MSFSLKMTIIPIAVALFAISCTQAINTKPDQFTNALMAACLGGDIETVRTLINKEANVNATPNSGSYAGGTPLTAAVSRTRIDVAELLLESKADPNLSPVYQGTTVTPLMVAVNQNNIEMARLLIRKGARPNIMNRVQKGVTDYPMIMAAGKGNIEMVKLFLENGSNVNEKNNVDITALMLACRVRNMDLVKLLVEKGANVNAISKAGDTALFYAAYQKKQEIVDYLLSKGADGTMKDSSGKTYKEKLAEIPDRFWEIQANYTGDDGTSYVEVFWFDSVQSKLVAYQAGTADDPKSTDTNASDWIISGRFDSGGAALQQNVVNGASRIMTQERYYPNGRYSIVVAGTGMETKSAFGTWKVVSKKASYP